MKHLTLLIALNIGISAASLSMDRDHDKLVESTPGYGKFTSHCPSSAELRSILRDHQADVEAGKDFTFTHNKQTWNVRGIQRSTLDTLSVMTLDDILKLPLMYNTDGKFTWALAQFSEDGINALTFHLNKAINN